MRKLPTGEPCAGEPHARFGGRGGRALIPTPIELAINQCFLSSLFPRMSKLPTVEHPWIPGSASGQPRSDGFKHWLTFIANPVSI